MKKIRPFWVNFFSLSIICASLFWIIFWVVNNPKGPTCFTPDGGVKYLKIKDFAAGKLYLDLRVSSREEWVRELWEKGFYPFKPPFVYKVGEKFYPVYPPLFQLLSSPFYFLWGETGLCIIPALSFLALILLFWRLCTDLHFDSGGKILSLLSISFGSPLLIYGIIFWEFTFKGHITWISLVK